MTVADCPLYVAIIGEIGIASLAVTTSLTINFLRKPSATKDIIGKFTLLKIGKSLVVGEFLYILKAMTKLLPMSLEHIQYSP
ncbi:MULTISPECIES: PaaI family thioesterase [unclassified Colwellia]|uniref:PaaI family thioesterase n=1 Tax=unclassified Colwellia TaxID=196834 RepID=UPI0021754446|nr:MULTISPECIES: hypothetical protein [unclassified Colwellia]